MEEIPYIFEIFSSEPGIRLFPKRVHILIEMTGRVNSVEGEKHRINYAGFGKVETRRFRRVSERIAQLFKMCAAGGIRLVLKHPRGNLTRSRAENVNGIHGGIDGFVKLRASRIFHAVRGYLFPYEVRSVGGDRRKLGNGVTCPCSSPQRAGMKKIEFCLGKCIKHLRTCRIPLHIVNDIPNISRTFRIILTEALQAVFIAGNPASEGKSAVHALKSVDKPEIGINGYVHFLRCAQKTRGCFLTQIFAFT